MFYALRAMIYAATLTSCAHAAAPASEPVAAPRADAPRLPPAPIAGILYDETAMREVIAGCRLLVGDERGRTVACEKHGRALTARVGELTDLARRLQLRSFLGPLIAGVGGLVLGAVIGAVIVLVLRPGATQ